MKQDFFYNNNHKSQKQQQQQNVCCPTGANWDILETQARSQSSCICHLLKSLCHEDIPFFSAITDPQNSPEQTRRRCQTYFIREH